MNQAPVQPLSALKEQSLKGLQYLVNYMLANAEQALLGMAGKAQGKAEQGNIHDALREMRLKRRALESAYIARVMAGFDAVGEAPAAPAPEQAPKPALDAGSLGLMHEQNLEERISAENLASRARIDHRDALLRLGRCIANESNQRRIDIDAVPVGPLALIRCFTDTCSELQVGPQARLVFLKLFSRFVVDELGPYYTQCVAALPAGKAEPEPLAPANQNQSLPPAALPTGEPIEEQDSPQPLRPQHELAWDSSRTPLLAAPGRAMAMPRSLLDQVLLGLQKQLLDRKRPLPALNPKAGIQPLEVFELVNGALAEMGYSKPLAITLDIVETVNLVRLLFEHALREQNVAPPVRRLARLLQIPVLRAALQDPEVLNGADHPVRVFFREIGTAAIGWAPETDLASDPFFRKIQALVVRIIGGFEKDPAVFVACLAELRDYLKSEQGRSRLLEQRTLNAEMGKTEAQAAREAISAGVRAAIGDAPLPRELLDFLHGSWSDALFVIRLQDGEDSASWGLAIETTGRLVAACAQGGATDFAALSHSLKHGLQRLGIDEGSAAAQVSSVGKAIASFKAGGSVATPVEPVAPPVRPPAAAEYLQLVDKLAPDTWIEFRLPGTEAQRARLLTKFPRTGQFLFVNREGAKAGDWLRNDLASLLEKGEAVILTGPGGTAQGSAPGRWGRR